jgi:hypothetical protein
MSYLEKTNMPQLEKDIEDFTAFAKKELSKGVTFSIDEFYDRWREGHPVAEDALAVQASLRDMEKGEIGRPFDEFASDFAKRNNITDDR